MTNINSAFSNYDESVEKSKTSYSGLLGLAINGNRIVNHPTRAGYVYVRLRDNLSEVVQAFNDKVSPVYDFPVLIQRKGNRWYVLGRDDLRYESWGTSAPYLPRHGDQHSFNRDGGGGGDVVWTYPDQFMPLLVYPSGTYGAGTLRIAPYVLQKANNFIYVGNTGTANLLPYKPTNSNAIMGLVYLDRDTGNPGVLINSGTPLNASITGTNGVIPYVPFPSDTQEPLYAFRLVSGTTSLTWDNLYNVRQFIGGSTSTGTSSGVSSHNSLSGIQGGGTGSYYHLNATQISGLVSGSVTTLHSHSLTGTVSNHESLTGLLGGSASNHWHLNSSQIIGLVSGTSTTLHSHSGTPTSYNFVTGSIAFADTNGQLIEDNKHLRYNQVLRSVRMGKDFPFINYADLFPIFITAENPGESPVIGTRSWGTGTSGLPFSGFAGYRSRGTIESPLPVQEGDLITSFFGQGYDGGDFWTASRIRTYANQNWVTGTYRGSRMEFWTIPDDSPNIAKTFVIGEGGVASNVTANKTLTLTATNDFTLTVPATGTAALLATANVFTADQTLGGAADPKLILNEGNTGTSLFEIIDTSSAIGTIKKTTASGASLIDIDPIPSDGTSNASFRFFRSTNTTGQVYLQVYKGDGTATLGGQISGNSANPTYFGTQNNVGIGTSSPGGKLDVTQASTTGTISVMDLEQLDTSEEYFNFIAAATGAGNPIDTATAVGTVYGRLRIAVNGTFKYLEVYNA